MRWNAKMIARYLADQLSPDHDFLDLPPNHQWSIYFSPFGLDHTRGSWQMRDTDYNLIMVFRTGDEPPETFKDLHDSVAFQLKAQTGKTSNT